MCISVEDDDVLIYSNPPGPGRGRDKDASTEVQSPHSMTLKRKEVEQYSIGTELSEGDVVLMLTMMILLAVTLLCCCTRCDVFYPNPPGPGARGHQLPSRDK